MVDCEPTINTIIHEKKSTTIVLIAVATVESVFLIPHFARIEVTPAKIADKTAKELEDEVSEMIKKEIIKLTK